MLEPRRSDPRVEQDRRLAELFDALFDAFPHLLPAEPQRLDLTAGERHIESIGQGVEVRITEAVPDVPIALIDLLGVGQVILLDHGCGFADNVVRMFTAREELGLKI